MPPSCSTITSPRTRPASIQRDARAVRGPSRLPAGNHHRVLPVETILESLENGDPLPENSIAITFDDAYRSVYNIARPMLDARSMPYSVFVSTEFIDRSFGNYMTWEQLRRMTEGGGTIGNHGVKHQSALARGREESREDWLERFRLDAVQAQERISAETGTRSTAYALP
ncbi:MAG: polysaccharide deacetylase family protein [Woeseiaceae bacterium]|nr:polysaccharide deacetylase family protein [Woeseiaceae bacterium]